MKYPRLAAPHFFLQQQQESYEQGLLALQQGHLQIALEQLTLAEHDQPGNASIHNFRGIALAQLGHTPEAAAEYREAIRLDAHLEAAYRNLGFLEWNNHQLDLARDHLNSALERAPEDTFARYYLGRVHLESQSYEAAFRELQRSGIPLPDDPDVQMQAARGELALGGANQIADARQRADSLLSKTLSDPQTSHLATLLLALHESDAAIQLLQVHTHKARQAGEQWANFDLSLLYLQAGKYERALDEANRFLTSRAIVHQSPATAASSAEAWSLIGITSAHLGDPDHAVKALQQATIQAPEREEHWLNLTRELMELNRFSDALTATNEAISLHPRSYALQLRLGAANLAVDRYGEAETIFRKLILAGDPLPTSYIGLAQVLLRTGHADQAVTELATAKEALGPSFLLDYFQALAFNRAGQPSAAASALREALQQNPESAEAHFELGKTELKQANFDAAITQLEAALHLRPADPQARRLLKQAYLRSGNQGSVQQPAETSPSAPSSNLVGDFILPSWQDPPANKGNSAPPAS